MYFDEEVVPGLWYVEDSAGHSFFAVALTPAQEKALIGKGCVFYVSDGTPCAIIDADATTPPAD